jgi:hypothetical protein
VGRSGRAGREAGRRATHGAQQAVTRRSKGRNATRTCENEEGERQRNRERRTKSI